MSRYALVGARVVLARTIDADLAVLVRDGEIEALMPYGELPPGLTRLDAGGRYLTPGLIDLHTHGAAGHGFDTPDAAGYDAVLAAHARSGVTAVQASLATSALSHLAECLSFAAGYRPSGVRLIGVHLEGPFLAPEQAGAHDPALLREPRPEDVEALLRAGSPTMVTLAPELPGGIAATRAFAGAGAVVAIGHSQAAGAEFAAAVAAGATHLTHLWSGQSALRREGPWRVPGLLEESLASTGLSAEVIADDRHLPPELLRIAYRCLGGRLTVVSDSTPGLGLAEGTPYRLGNLCCVVEDGVGMLPDRTAFAGSTTGLDRMLGHLRRAAGLSVPETVATATRVPAAVLGLRRQGTLRPGGHADLALLDDDLTARATVVGGRWLMDLDGVAGDGVLTN
ncbi:N-acetylglucosamine-6-phosphate deacetylase [Nonomuraea sp. NPDC059007]|uniref:N-acetylglucosamine-6-phosphate deacetylase n=1 Tax=Nonomuraea sp. NPDC059007 TaxID=3346692 RepID=UPI0036AAFA2F